MLFSKVIVVLGLVAFSEALSVGVVEHLHPRHVNLRGESRALNRRQAANTCLQANAIQTGSASTGQDPPVAGQANSATDNANFINFCSGQTVTNGLQVKGGSCNGIVMGKLPSTANMISAIIVSPKPGENLAASQTFTLSVQITGLQAGAFTNAQKTYYAAPQDLNGNGQIIGHTHLTVQDIGANLEPTNPPDPTKFVFFKGINDAGNGNGLLSTTVTGGLPPGNYRVCSMTSASNHQPVLMPVAQRGAQDDCQKFTVGAAGGAGGNAGGGNNGGGNTGGGGAAASSSSSSVAAGASSASSAAASAPTTSAAQATTTSAAQATTTSAAKSSTTSAAPAATGAAGALGGIQAPPITNSGDPKKPFAVNGNNFVHKPFAKKVACDIQKTGCSDAVNSGKLKGVSIADCVKQQTACRAS